MNTAAWIALAGVLITLAINLIAFGVAWGVIRTTVTALAARVAALETEMATFTTSVGDLRNSITRVETGQNFMLEQLKDLNASIRWMRDPAPERGAPK